MTGDVLDSIDFSKAGGLIPVVVQDAGDGDVLMVGYVNRQAVELTLQTGRLHFWSRSRQEIWLKGEKSGNYLLVEQLLLDCDGDSLLALVQPATSLTPICHTGSGTCFVQRLDVSD